MRSISSGSDWSFLEDSSLMPSPWRWLESSVRRSRLGRPKPEQQKKQESNRAGDGVDLRQNQNEVPRSRRPLECAGENNQPRDQGRDQRDDQDGPRLL